MVDSASAPKLRLLVVEDEALVLEDLRDMLTELGHDVVATASDGATAIRKAEAERPDLALLDIHIHGNIDGIAVARHLAGQLDIPAIFVTANADTATLEKATQAEPFGFVVKPFTERDLRAAISVAMYRHRAERKVRDMEGWLSTTLRSIGDAVIATDRQGRVSFVNATAEMLTGWSRADAVGRLLGEVFAVQTSQGPGDVGEIFASVVESGIVFHLTRDYHLRTKGGRLLPIDDSIAPIRAPTGEIEGVVVVFRDRTAAQRAEQARREFEQRTQEAQRLEGLGLLAGGIAHDFNNLLGVIVGHATVEAEQAPPGTELAESLAVIVDAARRGAGLCAQLLTYAGKQRGEPISIDLAAFVADTARLLRISIPRSIAVSLDLEPGVLPIAGDPSQLQQVVMNLVLNAVDALAGRGSVSLRTRTEHVDRVTLASARVGQDLPPGTYASLEVSDDGPGMSAETLSRIFEPFFTTKPNGRGLGLSAVLGIVRNHDAALHVASTPGAGTTFRLLFRPVVTTTTFSSSPPSADGDGWTATGRVLVVDDEEAIARLAGGVLERVGFEVVRAGDGAEALAIFERTPDAFRLVLTDMTMPRMSGLEASLRMRARRPELPIILMSGYSTDDAQAKDAGFAARLDKPFSAQALRSAVRRVLEGG